MLQGERLKIFVSSTVDELKDARAVAKKAIEDFQFNPLMCENWGATTESARSTYLKKVNSSDIYIGIFWKNYSKATEEEYREAKKLGKDILIYIKKEANEYRNEDLRKLLLEVKDLENGHIYYEYDTVIDLKEKIKDNISEVVSRRERQPNKFITYDNLVDFCNKQIKTNIDYIRGTCEEKKYKKYISDLYVERGELEEKFKEFLKSDKNCAVAVGEAGVGKTNLVCHLSEKYVTKMPVLFYDANNFSYVNKTIEDEILDDFNSEFDLHLTFSNLIHNVNKLLYERQTKIVIFIDAINECLWPDILKVDLTRTVQKNKTIKFFISCRDIDWDFFSNKNDKLMQNTFYNENDKNAKMYPEKRILWFQKFTETEFIKSWEKYKEVYGLKGELTKEVKDICMHPIMLRFLAEAFEGEYVPKDIRRKQIFDKYWERKLIQTGKRFKAEEQIFKIVSAFKERKVGELPESEIYEILGETTDEQNSTITKILSEDLVSFKDKENIIFQTKINRVGDRAIGFTYEAFFEYVLARYILYREWKYKNRAEKLEAFNYLVKNTDEFKYLKGTIAFLILLSEGTENNIQLDMLEILHVFKSKWIDLIDITLKFENKISIKDALFLLWNKAGYLESRSAYALGQIMFDKKCEKLKEDIIQRISTVDDDCGRDIFLAVILKSEELSQDVFNTFEDLTMCSNKFIADIPLHMYRLLAESHPELVPLNKLERYFDTNDLYTKELVKQVLKALITSKISQKLINPYIKESVVEPVETYDKFNSAISKICATMRMQRSIKERALSICLKIIKEVSLNEIKHEEIIGVSIYISCQQCRIPRDIEEISEVIGIDKKNIYRLLKFLNKEFQFPKNTIDARIWAQYMCIQLNLDSLVYDKTNEILKGYDVQIGETIINQKGLAAGAVYIGTILEGDRRTQKEVANAARISVSTVYKYYRLLAEKVDIEIIL